MTTEIPTTPTERAELVELAKLATNGPRGVMIAAFAHYKETLEPDAHPLMHVSWTEARERARNPQRRRVTRSGCTSQYWGAWALAARVDALTIEGS